MFVTLIVLLIFMLWMFFVSMQQKPSLKRRVEKAMGYSIEGTVKRLPYSTIEIKGTIRGEFMGGDRIFKNATLLIERDGTTKFVGGMKMESTPAAKAKREIKKDWKRVLSIMVMVVILAILMPQLCPVMVIPIGTARTWGGGSSMTGNWGDATCWTGDSVPGVGDTITFDATNTTACSVNVVSAALASLTVAATYSGTITVNINQTGTKGAFAISGGTGVYNTNGYNEFFTTVTINSGGTLTAGASAISCGGNWTGNFTFGTSTVIFTANGNIAVSYNYSIGSFYNITINTGVTVNNSCTGSGFFMKGAMTLLGTAIYTSNANKITGFGAVNGPSTNPPIVRSGSDTFTPYILYFYHAGSTLTLPALTGVTTIYFVPHSGTTTTATMTGAISCGTFIGNAEAMNTVIINTANYAITATTSLSDNGGNLQMTCGSSTITIGAFSMTKTTSYLTMNTSAWSVGGNWTNASTSASWNAGTATINFNGTGAQTLGLNNGNSANIKYYNITISNSGAVNVTMGANTTTILGALNCSTTTATIKWDTNNGGLALTGNLTLASGCGWTAGSGNMTFNGSAPQVITDNNSTRKNLSGASGTVIISTGAVVNYQYVLTISGSLSGTPTTDLSGNNTATWTNLIIQGTGVLHTCATFVVTSPAGGETWGVGQERNVTWLSGTTPFKIELSVNSGSTYPTTIVASTPSSPYTWRITGLATSKTTCRVKVTDSLAGSGASAADFTINNNNLVITKTDKKYNAAGTLYKTETEEITYDTDDTVKKSTKTVS